MHGSAIILKSSILKTTLYRESLHSLYKTPLFCISTNRVSHFQNRTDLPVASWTRATDGEESSFPKHFLRWIAKIQAVVVTADWEGLLPLKFWGSFLLRPLWGCKLHPRSWKGQNQLWTIIRSIVQPCPGPVHYMQTIIRSLTQSCLVLIPYIPHIIPDSIPFLNVTPVHLSRHLLFAWYCTLHDLCTSALSLHQLSGIILFWLL